MVDLSLWLGPLDGANPSGEDLRNDPRFHELERLIDPPDEVIHDDNNKPTSEVAVAVDWQAVLRKAEELRPAGRDLRLLIIVTRALTNEQGLAGLTEGLTLMAQTFDQHWETMHPALRPASTPRDMALRRINTLLDLQNANTGLLGNLRRMKFLTPRGFAPISGRDLEQGALDDRLMLQEAAQGLSNSERSALSVAHEQLLARLRGGLAAQIDQQPDVVAALTTDLRGAIAALDTLDKTFNARIETSGPAVPVLSRFLERMLSTMQRGTRTAPAAEPAAASPVVPAPAVNGHDRTHAPAPQAAATLPDRINSRDDVVKCLDLVIAFYDRTEPSSPIPHLARRVRRMVPMDFVELMEDLAPSGLKEFRLLAGVPETKKTPQKDER
ncbi:type VI secretion system protein TssA [Aminobacter sp. HY435]|uniref:type VI secretion system protein TssA n=1 Tax=Aminobacter sp. HY435 TaxID=2970917 RepID=UPI0022B9D04A|nr:type VI secretion system protein TssA [Aminobacter sp. HY435]